MKYYFNGISCIHPQRVTITAPWERNGKLYQSLRIEAGDDDFNPFEVLLVVPPGQDRVKVVVDEE